MEQFWNIVVLIIGILLIFNGGIVMTNKTHEHVWHYYGVEVEKETQSPENYTGFYEAHKYKCVNHYRACECGKVERIAKED